MNASTLLLVKSFAINEPQPDIEEMVRRGWVDARFAQFAASRRFQVRVLGKGDQEAASRMLTSGAFAGVANAG
jgi:hypothetical protein